MGQRPRQLTKPLHTLAPGHGVHRTDRRHQLLPRQRHQIPLALPHSKGRPVEDLEKARWYLCHVIDHDEKIAWTRQQHAILDTLANDPAIPDAEAHTWAKLRQGFPYSALACLDRLIEHERNQQ